MPDQLKFEYDVFISYSSHDHEWVRGELLKRIEQAGLRVFIDFRDFKGGAPGIREMERGVSTARKTLLVLTPDYIESGWCEIENIMLQTLDPANRNLRLIPLLKTQCQKPLRIGALTHVDFTDGADFELAWHQLLTALEVQVERRAETATQTTMRAKLGRASGYIAKRIRQYNSGLAITLFVLLLSTVGLGYWFFHQPAPIESIAVLPFQNASGDPDLEYLSDGMTELLIESLSHIPKLLVKARASVFRYKGKEVEPQTIAAELSVQAILSGRIVQRGADLTLYLSLVDASTGNQLWGERYTRKQADMVSLQQEIAGDVAQELRARLSGADEQRVVKSYTANAAAYQLFLRARLYQSKATPQDSQKAVEYFQQAIALDSNFAGAYAGLAATYTTLSAFYDVSNVPARDLMLKAKEAALHALSLDNQLAEAHSALGRILFFYDYDFAGAEREFKRAIELKPNDADVHTEYGKLLMSLGRQEESFVELHRALAIDPLSINANLMYGYSLFYARRYDEAIAQLKNTADLDANYMPTHASLGIVYQMKGDYAASVAERSKINELVGRPQTAAFMRDSFASGGWRGFLRAMTGDRRPLNIPPYIVATCHVELGEKDKAFTILNKLYDDRATDLVMIKTDPRLDPLRSDPRFQDLLRRVGLMP